MHYTAVVKHASVISFICIILIAVMAGFFVVNHQRASNIAHLLGSPAVADNIDGINLAEDKPFDDLVVLFEKILSKHNEASTRAQEVLVARAFDEHRVHALKLLPINRELLEAVIWWSEDHKETSRFTSSTEMLLPSLHQLAWLLGVEEAPTMDVLVETPVQDRDGSVVLGVLAIKKFTTQQERHRLIHQWMNDFSLARQKSAVLLAMMEDKTYDFPPSQRPELSTIQAIQKDTHYLLAWRTLHDKDGMIIPDIALAGMLANQEKFFPILINSAQEHKWKHPEHAILIASYFAPRVAGAIPFDYLQNTETRKKWWSLFTCGLLLERR